MISAGHSIDIFNDGINLKNFKLVKDIGYEAVREGCEFRGEKMDLTREQFGQLCSLKNIFEIVKAVKEEMDEVLEYLNSTLEPEAGKK